MFSFAVNLYSKTTFGTEVTEGRKPVWSCGREMVSRVPLSRSFF